MFNVTGGELVIIFLAALVILGPERLPEAARTVGKVMAQLRSVSQGFQKELKSAIDETGEPFREMVRPRLTPLDGGARPDLTEKPRSAAMFDANSPALPEPDPDPGWSTPPRPELPVEQTVVAAPAPQPAGPAVPPFAPGVDPAAAPSPAVDGAADPPGTPAPGPGEPQ